MMVWRRKKMVAEAEAYEQIRTLANQRLAEAREADLRYVQESLVNTKAVADDLIKQLSGVSPQQKGPSSTSHTHTIHGGQTMTFTPPSSGGASAGNLSIMRDYVISKEEYDKAVKESYDRGYSAGWEDCEDDK